MPSALKLSLALVLGCASCGPGGRERVDGDPGDPDAPGEPDGPSSDAFIPDYSRVYAHSGSMLYRVDTLSLTPEVIGPITGLGTQSLTDLAVDSDDNMVGITLDKVVSIDPETGAATLLADMDDINGFTSLCFVPLDLSDPHGPDRLVAANDQGEVYEINPDTGAASLIGDYGTVAAGKVRSSGDLIAVSGFGIYATVTIGDDLTDPDYLARIDPDTWIATPLGIGTTYDRIFGLGFWRDTIYGFVDNPGAGGGAFISLDRNTGASTLIEAGAIRWYGAGVATDAPVVIE
jgi:hypothetical protein